MADPSWKKLPILKSEGGVEGKAQPSWKALPVVRPDGVEPGTPLALALEQQDGPVVTVQTPTGPAQFTRNGRRFYGPDEAEQMMGGNRARLAQDTAKGALSFLSGGGPLVDEMAGSVEAVKSVATDEPISDAYRRGRDQTRAEVRHATRDVSPNMEMGGVKVPVLPALGAAVPAMLAPLPATWVGRVASSAVQGAEAAAGASEADLTQGEVGEFVQDVGVGGGTGAVSAGATEGLTAPLRLIGRGATAQAGAAKEAVTAARQAVADKAVSSATGTIGKVTSMQGNSMETVMEVLRNPQWFTDDVVREAWAIAESPEGKLMLSRAASNNFAKLRQGFAAETPAREALAQATQAAQPAAVASEVSAMTRPDAIAQDFVRKGARSLGPRLALAAGGAVTGRAVGALTGDEAAGTTLGALAGFGTPGTLQFLRNQASSPVMQYGANAAMSRLLQGASGAAAREAATVAPMAQQSRQTITEQEEEAIQAFLTGG